MPKLADVSHVSLSVTDAARTARWWQDVFALSVELTLDDEEGWHAVVLGLTDSIAIEFQQHDANRGEAFDPTRTGFDHMGLKVDTREELDEWEAHFSRIGVTHTPVVERDYGSPSAVLTFKDPDRIQFEMFWMEGHP